MPRFSFAKSYQTVWPQGLFWLGYFLFEWLNTGAYRDNFQDSLHFISFHLPLLILAGYWHLLVTVRHFLLPGRTIGFWLSLVGGIFVFGILRRAINYLILYPGNYPAGLTKPFWNWPKILTESMHVHLVVGLFVAVEVVRQSLKQQQVSETYRREKLSAEYRLLQSQVQPHFLFNTLNNLVAVSRHQAALMPHLLQRLAGLLSYQLHESHRITVPISKELQYLNDYIALEKIRYGNRLDVTTNFDELTHLGHVMIPPMLLLPFVENAFKHGASQTDEACWIQIHLFPSGERLVFTVENSLPDGTSHAAKTGLGLTNLEKRLDILYPGSYELVTLPEEGQFLAVLKFNLN